MDASGKPSVYVIAGPNGAGKTTFASEYLPGFVKCREFLNADLIATGLSPFAPDTQNLRAGRLLLERIKELSDKRANFGLETTLCGRSWSQRHTSNTRIRWICQMDDATPPSMTDLANAAFRQAAKKVIQRAIETHTPIIVYRDGVIVKLDPVTMQPINEPAVPDLQQPST